MKNDEEKPTVGKLVEDDVLDPPSKDDVGKNGEINTRVCFFFFFSFFFIPARFDSLTMNNFEFSSCYNCYKLQIPSNLQGQFTVVFFIIKSTSRC